MTIQDRQILEPTPDRGPPEVPQRVMPGAERKTWVSWGIIAGSALMFLVFDKLWMTDVVVDGVSRGSLPPGTLYGPLVREGQWWRVLWMVLEHGSPLHILFNMSAVWTLGRSLEVALGSWRFFLISLITAIGASTFCLFFAFNQPTVGASGMILGWAGTMLVISSADRRRSLGSWLLQVAVISFLPGISWQGHLGGFLFGLPCGLALRMGPERFNLLAPILLFLAAVAAFLAGAGVVRLPL